ncbi:predicted protein [Plenodomus lingam JN3]|uniref:Uncharacterized protein n=1 Tax=Leptosphaeria maculans (strain JN3 / isolate v23.1.3 / race Av1-4-5-6-7-8) TaxID=985895 RepID=E4ZG76_LEPMJ|nr:predicted protein [Plenodomus lingam JN3]CBX90296.1 predicted protein [Plenodomus lingam JN3]
MIRLLACVVSTTYGMCVVRLNKVEENGWIQQPHLLAQTIKDGVSRRGLDLVICKYDGAKSEDLLTSIQSFWLSCEADEIPYEADETLCNSAYFFPSAFELYNTLSKAVVFQTQCSIETTD